MSKKDITESELYISKLSQTYRGFLPRRVIPMRVEGRASDGLILVLAGQCHYLLDDGTAFTAAEGDVLYLAKDAKYAMNVDCERYEFFVINFFFADQDTRKSAVLRPRDRVGIEQLFARLCTRRDLASVAESLSVFYRILAATVESKQSYYMNGKMRATVERAAETVRNAFGDPHLSASRLAADAAMSEVHFRRLFARRFGVSPARYIMQTRISHARELMATTTLSTDEIAEKSGFSSVTYFHRVFRELTDTTPAAYRRELRERPL